MSLHYWIDAVLAGFSAVVFVLGMILYLVQAYQRTQFAPSKFWPSVVGTITASALQQTAGKATYYAAVRYGYRVGKKDYESDRIFWGPREGGEKAMAELVAAYPVGRDVWVHHEPKNPANAVLEPARNTTLTPAVFYYAIALMVLGLIGLGAGLYALSH